MFALIEEDLFIVAHHKSARRQPTEASKCMGGTMSSTRASSASRLARTSHTSRGEHAPSSAYNSHHRYSVLKGVTPDEYEKRLGFEARLLAWRRAPDLAASPRLDRVRQAHPIQPRVEDPRIQDLDATGVRACYVTAVLHVRTQRLVVECAGHPWRAELPFSLKR